MATYPPDLEQYIDEKVRSGQFRSREEFAAAAAQLYRELEARHAALKADIAAALSEAEGGQSSPLDIDAICAELTQELDESGEPR